MKNGFVISILYIFLSCCTSTIDPPYHLNDVANPLITLNGKWKINVDPRGNFWETDDTDSTWKDIIVPGECMMQGIPIKHDRAFVYKKKFEIPLDFKGKEIIIRFDGVYSYAKVWINGNYVRDHFGGFTRWDCNITQYVRTGETAMLTLEVTDRADEISYASGYAKHQIGGILRDVFLMAVPSNYPANIKIITDLDENYVNANLIVSGVLNEIAVKTKIKLSLTDKNNKRIYLENSEINLNETDSFEIKNIVPSPYKWDAEHPNLYRLLVSYFEDDKLIYSKIYQIGFREVEIKRNKLYVNGMETKLKGVCRHDIHPLLGRIASKDYELKDVLLAKEANINFIRTSHYPPSDNFLQLCDEYGIYVEDETAVCFVGTYRTQDYLPGSSENDTSFTSRYLSQVEEMVLHHENHPSVIIWSIGNESMFGVNIRKSYESIKKYDNTRPVIFSYPGYVPDSIRSYDILSMHYPDLTGNMDQMKKVTRSFSYDKMPVIFDEWAHVPCYNTFTLKEDPNVRDFWGISLDSMYQKTFASNGGTGGAIWGFVDEIFMLPSNLPGFGKEWGKFHKESISGEYAGPAVGYGEWGIVDVWRRKKPEFWNTKKAYSPVRLLKTEFEDYRTGQSITIPVLNRFDHSSLSELNMIWTYMGIRKTLRLPEINPHATGEINIIPDHWDSNEPIFIDFFSTDGLLIDSYRLWQKKPEYTQQVTVVSDRKIELIETSSKALIICENGIEFEIDKNTGLFTRIKTSINEVTFSGPFLNYRILNKSANNNAQSIDQLGTDWELNSLSITSQDDKISVILNGNYLKLKNVDFVTYIYGDGSIMTGYSVNDTPEGLIREVGVKFILENIFDTVSWQRNPYWSSYPTGYLSADIGEAAIYPSIINSYRQEPKKSWESDSKSFYYNGISDESVQELTFHAKATKENISKYYLFSTNNINISVLPVKTTSCRLGKNKDLLELFIINQFDYPDLSWGNYQRNIASGGNQTGKVRLIIHTKN